MQVTILESILVGYHGEPKVNLLNNIRIIYYPKRLKVTYSATRTLNVRVDFLGTLYHLPEEQKAYAVGLRDSVHRTLKYHILPVSNFLTATSH